MNITRIHKGQRIETSIRVTHSYDEGGLGRVDLYATEEVDRKALRELAAIKDGFVPDRASERDLLLGGLVNLRSQTADEQQALDALAARQGQAHAVDGAEENEQTRLTLRVVTVEVEVDAAPAEVEGDEPTANYEAMTLAQLKTIVAERQVKVDGPRKADYVAALKAADAAPAEVEGEPA